MVDSVHGRSGEAVPRTDRDGQPTPARSVTARPAVATRIGPVMRRRRLAPYLLLLPSAVAIGLVLVWPTIQIGLFSAQNYGLPQVTGSAHAVGRRGKLRDGTEGSRVLAVAAH